MFHEYLLVEIVHTGSVQASLAVTERVPEKNDGYSTKQAVSPSVYGRVAANDTVRIVGGTGISELPSHNKLSELQFDANELPLLNLAILLNVVRKHAQYYDVWKYQCYWYANTVYQSVQDLFKSRKDHVEPAFSKHRGKVLLGLPQRKDSVGAIIGEYNAAMEDIRKEKIKQTTARLADEKKVCSWIPLLYYMFTFLL